ncbi:hypothetical protein DPMN_090539 [Dreissena polymorpha]|uniref:E2F-associated phosphoprotein n=2 Tax=Dreissena polymorpha TaxID=45954 RepID=A0A9D4KXW8_DREPO|nr:hypothetical protein DPMN_090539 [Dreissena polymorpha]
MDRDLDYLDFDDDSDNDHAESSDDEIDILLHGTPEQKRKLTRPQTGQRRVKGQEEEDDLDEFEKEMNEELNGRVKEMERRRGSFSEAVGCSSKTVMDLDAEEPVKFYDDVYFDSDEEDMVSQGDAAKNKRKQPSNDDLLYNPEEDDDNEKWMETQRRSYLPHPQPGRSRKQKPLPNSDAILDCPACMTTLCLDCQRHDVYNNQYRAMFVSHCKVDTSELLKFPKGSKLSKKQKRVRTGDSAETADDGNTGEMFNPVKCEECNTVVAVYDRDEVYHFFNVLASY